MKPDSVDGLPEDADMSRLIEALRDPEHPGLRRRVFERVAHSVAQHRSLITSRGGRRALWTDAAAGVRLRTLYAESLPQRPGQPRIVQVVELAAGARWTPDPVAAHSQVEWLVLAGDVRLEGEAGAVELHPLDFHVHSADAALPVVIAASAARLYMRHAPRERAAAATSRETAEDWLEMAPGILRRRLWNEGGEAAYLVRAERGAQVPEHGHGHDEECLMLEGDLFLGDILLREGDWQLAPQGTQHGHHFTDTGLLLLVRGDAVMQFVGV